MSRGICLCVMMAANGVLLATSPVSAAFSHDDWAAVLDRFVSEDGLVDYAALAEDREELDRYVRAVETTSPQSDPENFPTRQHELAYFINAYNALVFTGVLERGPEEDSVWKGGLISGYGFFVAMKIRVGGDKTNLRKLENAVIREVYEDPRIHAALNCASMGCPRLPRVPFLPERLDEQLDDAIREFVSDQRRVRVDDANRTVYLSKIFDWFKSDFTEYEKNHGNPKGTVVDYINRYREPSASVPTDYRVKILDYDKRINKQGQPLDAKDR